MTKSPATKARIPSRKPQRPRIVYSTCRALVPLNTAEIRKRELKKLDRQKTNCAALDAQLEKFEKEEVQAHQQWIQTHCGPAITKYRTIRAEISVLEGTLNLTFDLLDFYPKRTQQECADAAVLYFETNGKIPEGYEEFFEPVFSAHSESSSNPFGDDEEDDFDDAFFEDIEAFIEEMANGASSNRGRIHSPRDERLCREEKTIKELYRRIARQLHPDGAGGATPVQLELWHAAQAAYENLDLETLERIDARCDLLDTESTKSAPVSSIQKGIAYYKKACTRFRRAIRDAKREPEWGFLTWSKPKKQRVLKEHNRELETEIRYFTRLLNDHKNQLKAMRNPPAALKRTPPKKRAPAKKSASAKPPEPQNDDQGLFDFF
ncbi:J domain-containing protein [Pontiella sulfatireligans]|uniref:J domain-containing protein n=1 Tax=Pontiella sulfatireligans TaxID=2750658 RepID=A0A6C2ULH0_9BACT|nr:J domain-containing protein [Pontiella sulfatireligans]VGO20267.1 hypothetical protein SCARR_02328 [Pontiella sulfatireligans]